MWGLQEMPQIQLQNKNLIREENEVVEHQELLLTLNMDKEHIKAKCAFTNDVHKLKDNIGQAIAFQKNIEKKLAIN